MATRPTFRIMHPTNRGCMGTVSTDDGRPVALHVDDNGIATVDDLGVATLLVERCGYCWDFEQNVAGHAFVDGQLVEVGDEPAPAKKVKDAPAKKVKDAPADPVAAPAA